MYSPHNSCTTCLPTQFTILGAFVLDSLAIQLFSCTVILVGLSQVIACISLKVTRFACVNFWWYYIGSFTIRNTPCNQIHAMVFWLFFSLAAHLHHSHLPQQGSVSYRNQRELYLGELLSQTSSLATWWILCCFFTGIPTKWYDCLCSDSCGFCCLRLMFLLVSHCCELCSYLLCVHWFHINMSWETQDRGFWEILLMYHFLHFTELLHDWPLFSFTKSAQ